MKTQSHKGFQQIAVSFSGLNTNRQRRDFWEKLCRERSAQQIADALVAIDPTSAQVLQWHYNEGKSLASITTLLNRSISTVRNHHNRGIFELQQYFISQQKVR